MDWLYLYGSIQSFVIYLIFIALKIKHVSCKRFSPGYAGTKNMFYFCYKIIFRLNEDKDDIRSACVYFNFFHETVNSHKLETANHIAHVIFMLHSVMKTHLLTNQNARTIQIISYKIMGDIFMATTIVTKTIKHNVSNDGED